jgi:hypothetical protein
MHRRIVLRLNRNWQFPSLERTDSTTSLNNNNNTFTWSVPSGVVGFTGQRRVAPLEHCALAEPAPVVPLNLPFLGFGST